MKKAFLFELPIRKFLYQGLTIPLLIPGHFSRHPQIYIPHDRNLFRSLEADILHSQMPEKASGPWNATFFIPPCQKMLVPGARPGLPPGARILWHGGWRIPAPRLEVRKNFFSQRVPEDWNKIPPVVKKAETAKAFRNAYRKHRLPEAAA